MTGLNKNVIGAEVHLREGQLIPPPIVPDTSNMLIIGTSNDGPVNFPLRLLTSERGQFVFGLPSNAPFNLMRGMVHAGIGGCRDMHAVRITGKYAETCLIDYGGSTDILTATNASGTYIGDGIWGGSTTPDATATTFQLGRDYWNTGAVEFYQESGSYSQTWTEYSGTAALGAYEFQFNRKNGWLRFGTAPDPLTGTLGMTTGTYWPHSIVMRSLYAGNKYNGYKSGTIEGNSIKVISASGTRTGTILVASPTRYSLYNLTIYYNATDTVADVIETVNTSRNNSFIVATLARHLTAGTETIQMGCTYSATTYDNSGLTGTSISHYATGSYGVPTFQAGGLNLLHFADDEEYSFANIPISDEGHTVNTFTLDIYNHLEPLATAASYGILKTDPGVYDMIEGYPVEIIVPFGMHVDTPLSGVTTASATSMNFASQMARYLYNDNLNGYMKWAFMAYQPATGAIETLAVQRSYASYLSAHAQTLNMYTTDTDGSTIDAGRYLKIYAGPDFVLPGANMKSAFDSPEALLAGYNSAIRHSVGLTAKVLPTRGIRFKFVPSTINSLNSLHFCVGDIDPETRRVMINRDDTFAQDIGVDQPSDWTMGASLRTGIALVQTILKRLKPMRGYPLNDHNIEAARATVEEVLVEERDHPQGGIRAYEFTLNVSPRDQILGDMTISLTYVPAGELRRIKFTLGLTVGL